MSVPGHLSSELSSARPIGPRAHLRLLIVAVGVVVLACLFAVVDYAANTGNLNYIDKTRIGVTGHSAGGNVAMRGAS